MKYSIITEIKKSNKGNIYLAKVDGHEFPVVVKELKHGNVNVFKALQEMDCEYLPKIHYVEACNEGLLVVEEYIEGELLTDYINSNNMSESQCIDIALQMCDALWTIHNHVPPVIHRDIKPSNVIVNANNRIKLIDFDSSREYKEDVDSDTRLLGTEKYAPPEQYGYSQTDCRSDIYSFGVVLDKLSKFISPKRSNLWKKIVTKCTHFAPDSRFQSVKEIRRELSKIKGSGIRNGVRVGIGLCAIVFMAFIFVLSESMHSDDKGTTDAMITDPVTPETDSAKIGDETYSGEQESSVEQEPFNEHKQIIEQDDKNEELPEYRDVETDSPELVALKEKIRNNHTKVSYFIKDRMTEKDFLLQAKNMYYNPEATLYAIVLYSYQDGSNIRIDMDYLTVENNIITINREFMAQLADGYYRINVMMAENDEISYEWGSYLYVASTDNVGEKYFFLQNTTFEDWGNIMQPVYLVLNNDSGLRISSLLYGDESPVEPEMFQVSEDGRILKISEELFFTFVEGSENTYYVVCEDGTMVEIRIKY